uniref:TPX2 central domain-containing protein n=1 Tax=Trichuris muris TaxID=70415 RepID=A0A5S6R1U2_TRIMR
MTSKQLRPTVAAVSNGSRFVRKLKKLLNKRGTQRWGNLAPARDGPAWEFQVRPTRVERAAPRRRQAPERVGRPKRFRQLYPIQRPIAARLKAAENAYLERHFLCASPPGNFSKIREQGGNDHPSSRLRIGKSLFPIRARRSNSNWEKARGTRDGMPGGGWPGMEASLSGH